ncbi:MAG: ABC transporter substrate-binding protein [Caldilineaceae bacterium]
MGSVIIKLKGLLTRYSCLLLLLLAACQPVQAPTMAQQSASTPALTPLKVCYSSNSATQSVALYAYEQGLFAKYGLAVELIYIEGGSTATAALMAGEADICQIAGAAVINSVVAGSDLVLIGGLFNTYPYSLMVRPEIQAPADLKGKALAISDPGSASDAAIRAALLSLGLQADQDVTLLATGGQGARLAAMETGAVAGTVVSVPETAVARASGYHELMDMAALQTPYQHTAIATSRHLIAEKRTVVTHFLQATLAAISQMKQDQAGVTAVLAKYLSLDPQKDAAVLSEAYSKLISRYLPSLPYPTVEGVQLQLDALVAENPNAAHFKAADVVDTTLLAEIEGSGFLTQLESK